MKRKSLMMMMILLLAFLVLTACAKTEKTSKVSDNPGGLSTDQTTSEALTGMPYSMGSGKQASNPVSSTGNKGNGATIIAQSNNAVTDSEKQKILRDLNGEIDNLINRINALDSIQESDLTFE